MSWTTKSTHKEDTLVRDKDLMQRFRIQVFEDYEAGRFETVTALCEHYGMSRRWFYDWKPRWEQHGPEGMMSRPCGPDTMPHAVEESTLGEVLEHVEEHPSHGCDRIAYELDVEISGRTIQRYLNAWDLGTVQKRQAYHRRQNGEVLTEDELSEIESDRRASKDRHIQVNGPGELVGIDLFYIGTLKGIGRIYQFTGVDCYSSFGFAGIYSSKTADNAVDFVQQHVLGYAGSRPIRRVLTDNGKEFTTHWENASHRFTDTLNDEGIRHTTTKVKHPWTNGHVERFQQTVLREFYQRVLQERRYKTIEALHADLDEYLRHYNFERPHQGRRTQGRSPSELFFEPTNQRALVA